jgi:hypothetical protein
VTMDGREWIERFSTTLGVAPPDDATIEQLLALAGVAAHASERTAAPIACYLVGLAGAAVAEALQSAQAMPG